MKNLPLASISKRSLRAANIALTLVALLAMANHSAQAQTYTVLYAFKGAPDGANPAAGLLRDGNGNLYGTTSGGGVHTCKNTYTNACGTVFKVDAAGKERRLRRSCTRCSLRTSERGAGRTTYDARTALKVHGVRGTTCEVIAGRTGRNLATNNSPMRIVAPRLRPGKPNRKK
jgi:hypothetical protein